MVRHGRLLSGLAVASLALAGCSAAGQPEEAAGAGETAAAPVTEQPEAAAPSTAPTDQPALTAYRPGNEVLLGALDGQTGPANLPGIETDAEALAVYVSCAGAGSIELDIPQVGTFPIQCLPGDSTPVRNQFDIRHTEGELGITVTGSGEHRWALSVSESATVASAGK